MHNKYLIFALTENNNEVLELYKKLWSEIKKQIKAINRSESIKYKNDFMNMRPAFRRNTTLLCFRYNCGIYLSN